MQHVTQCCREVNRVKGHGRLPPVSTLPGDEVKADKAPHGVGNQHSGPAVIHLNCMLNQLPHPVEMTRLHTMAVSSSALACDNTFLGQDGWHVQCALLIGPAVL